MVESILFDLAPIASQEVYQIVLERLAELENLVEIIESMEGK
jgi:hypothetical protein